MFEGTRRTSTYGSHGFIAKFTLSRETSQDIGCCHPTNKKNYSKILSGTTEAEATWEREDHLKKEFPYLFEDQLESRG